MVYQRLLGVIGPSGSIRVVSVHDGSSDSNSSTVILGNTDPVNGSAFNERRLLVSNTPLVQGAIRLVQLKTCVSLGDVKVCASSIASNATVLGNCRDNKPFTLVHKKKWSRVLEDLNNPRKFEELSLGKVADLGIRQRRGHLGRRGHLDAFSKSNKLENLEAQRERAWKGEWAYLSEFYHIYSLRPSTVSIFFSSEPRSGDQATVFFEQEQKNVEFCYRP